MSHTYTNILVHALFTTKDRRPWLNGEVREEVFRYLGGAVNELGGLVIGEWSLRSCSHAIRSATDAFACDPDGEN